MQLTDIRKEITINFKIEEVEYDRAEGAGISVDINAFNLKGVFYNIWLERTYIAALIQSLDDFLTQKQNAFHFHMDCLDFSFAKNTKNILLAGIKVRRDSSGKINDFPIEFSMSFEIEDHVVGDFMNELKKLEAGCRAS